MKNTLEPDIDIDIYEDESDCLDYKREWHTNKAKLLHDILALANSKNPVKTKRLIFGITEEPQRSIVGINSSLFRDESDLQDWLRKVPLNNPITVSLIRTKRQGKDVEILEVYPEAYRKPYFLYSDYVDGDTHTKAKAGAIYTRNGSSNTPINGTAKDQEAEYLWKERFGLHLKDPQERLIFELKKHFLHNVPIRENWELVTDSCYVLFNRSEPDLKICKDSSKADCIVKESLDAEWGALNNPSSCAVRIPMYCRWKGDNFYQTDIIRVDGPRHEKYLPSPMIMSDSKTNEPVVFCVAQLTMDYWLLSLFLGYFNQEVYIPRKVKLFHSMNEAKQYAKERDLQFYGLDGVIELLEA